MDKDGFYWVSIQGFAYTDISVNNITVDRKSDAIMSPVEEGSYIFDNKVIRPLTVTVDITVKEDRWESVYSRLLKMYENRRYEFYEVVTKGEVIGNLMMTGLPRKEVSDKFDAIDAELHFVQVVYVNERYKIISKPFAKSDTSTRCTGHKTLSTGEWFLSTILDSLGIPGLGRINIAAIKNLF